MELRDRWRIARVFVANDPIPSPDPDDLADDDPLGETSPSIFQRKELLRPGHVPDSDRIVGRDEEISNVENLLRDGVNGGAPCNAIIYGETGSGKSLVVRHVTGRARAFAQANDVVFISAYVDCEQENTLTRVARTLAQQAAQQSPANLSVQDSGISASQYMQYLYDVLEEADVFVAIIDEIDILDDDEVLSRLSRAEESGKTDCYIGVIAISNKLQYYDRLGQRARSSFSEKDLVFAPYDANQLREILRKREDAFRPGVLEDGVIPKVAALAAKEHGDARKAIDIMQSAGEVAMEEGDESVTEDHIDTAQEAAARGRVEEVLKSAPRESQYLLFALAYLTEIQTKKAYSTMEIYRIYNRLHEIEGGEGLSKQRVLQLLEELSFLEITESKLTGGGRGEGRYREHELMHETEIVLGTVFNEEKTKEFLRELRA